MFYKTKSTLDITELIVFPSTCFFGQKTNRNSNRKSEGTLFSCFPCYYLADFVRRSPHCGNSLSLYTWLRATAVHKRTLSAEARYDARPLKLGTARLRSTLRYELRRAKADTRNSVRTFSMI